MSVWVGLGALGHPAGQERGRLNRVLDRLVAAWPDDHLVLVMDNASYHPSPAVRAWWVQQAGRVTPWWLPVSAPQLHFIERVWCSPKQKLARHRFWNAVTGLEAAARMVLERTTARSHQEGDPSILLRQKL